MDSQMSYRSIVRSRIQQFSLDLRATAWRRSRLPLAVVLVVLAVGFVVAWFRATVAQDVAAPFVGEWVAQTYADKLARTRSPLQSRSGGITAFTLKRRGTAFDWAI